jgi:hypothetical protein
LDLGFFLFLLLHPYTDFGNTSAFIEACDSQRYKILGCIKTENGLKRSISAPLKVY